MVMQSGKITEKRRIRADHALMRAQTDEKSIPAFFKPCLDEKSFVVHPW